MPQSCLICRDVKIKDMKTNKEIKPFKMLVGNEGYGSVINILLSKGYKWNGYESDDIEDQPEYDDVMAITLEENFEIMRYTEIGRLYYEDILPELTYSEFMKLYGEEDEVFTREDMRCLCAYLQNKFDCEHWSGFDSSELINDFLSERTND